MKILHVNLSDRIGGASIAMHRIHEGLRDLDVDSNLLVRNLSDESLENRPEINLISSGRMKVFDRIRFRAAQQLSRLQKDPTCFFTSLNLFRNNLVQKINGLNPDLVNLHWVGSEILRIEDLPKIKAPIVWTMMDMWPFCGAEHYDFRDRWKHGYSKESRSDEASGIDWNRKVWLRKALAWKDVPFVTVSPSSWVRDCLEASSLFGTRSDCQHHVIPFGLNVSDFRPRDQSKCRTKHDLHGDSPLILFGADRIDSPMKGMNWLIEALTMLNRQDFEFRVASFGRGDIHKLLPSSIESVSLGTISSPQKLGEIYGCADLMAVPSRLESFGQTASESQACGVPVACFDSSGLRDIVKHQQTGYRARCFDVKDLAEGIKWCLSNPQRLESMRKLATSNATNLFAIHKVALLYKNLYENLLNR